MPRGCRGGDEANVERTASMWVLFSQWPVWICCNYEAVADHALKDGREMQRWDFRFASSVAEHTWVWSLQMPLSRAVRHDVGSSSSSIALGISIIKISLVAWSPLSCSVVSRRARHTNL